MSTLALNVNNSKISDEAVIDMDAATVAAAGGYIKVVINSLACVVIDQPLDFVDPVAGDNSPIFMAKNQKSVNGLDVPLLSHFTTKVSGNRNYTNTLMIFAVNDGKIDGNGYNFKASNARVEMVKLSLTKFPQYPCDDDVTATATYTTTWTAVP